MPTLTILISIIQKRKNYIRQFFYDHILEYYNGVIKWNKLIIFGREQSDRSHGRWVGIESGRREPCKPAVDYFKLIDFAFIVLVPCRTSILKLKRLSNERFIGLFLYRGRTDVNVSRWKVQSVLFSFLQTFVTWIFRFKSWSDCQTKIQMYLAPSNNPKG